MALREFNTKQRRESREKLKITIEDADFRRRRMTGGRFREILEADDELVAAKTKEEIDELSPEERTAYFRERSLDNADSIYRQVAQLIQPVDPAAVGVDVDDEEGLKDWLSDHLDWDDAPALLEWLDEQTSSKKGN